MGFMIFFSPKMNPATLKLIKNEEIFINMKIKASTVEDAKGTAEDTTEEVDKDTIVAADTTEDTADTTENTEDTKLELTPQELKQQKLALSYLFQFHSKQSWKFQKLRQIWLLNNMYYQHKMSNLEFKMMIEYCRNLSQGARKTTVEMSRMLVGESGMPPTVVKRAKKIIKLL